VLMVPFGPVELVYDLSQTEATDHAQPLPFNAVPFGMDDVDVAAEALAELVHRVRSIGVRVVTGRQGVTLAGRIRRVHDAGTMKVPSDKPGVVHALPVRWLVELNASHSPTQQLATLAHELGHLFCGHVGADQGDGWPSRDVHDQTQREFEAESVARLVFRRVAPGAELPPYLEHVLDPGQPPPDEGWTYVAQAADRVLEVLEPEGSRGSGRHLVVEPTGMRARGTGSRKPP